MLQPWQLIRLKSKYGGVYVAHYNGKLYVQRHPTLLEVTQQMDAKKAFKLTNEQMFIELAKQCLVYPDDPDAVPDGQLRMLAETMLDDIPLTEDELERKAIEIAQTAENIYKDIAVELWYRISGTTVHEFYNQPVKQVLEMYSVIKMLSEMMREAQSKQQQTQQPDVSLYNQYPAYVPESAYSRPPGYAGDMFNDEEIVTSKQAGINVAKSIAEAKELINKPLDEIIKQLANKSKR